MKKYMLWVFLCSPVSVFAQNANLNGFVKDAETGEALLFANCAELLSKTGVSTNAYGYFSISLPLGEASLKTSYIGYESGVLDLFLTGDTAIVISLKPKADEIDEIVINAHASVKEQALMGKTNVPVKTIKAVPSFLGEPDVLKAICFIPGVATGKEGFSHIYVRGGDRGQNLILLDGMKLYNTSHVGGFISLFNSDVIKHVDVYKGGFPAHYGGRTSSVIDIYTKDGNEAKRFGGKINLGLLNSGFMIEGSPHNDVSYLFAARSSYYDLFNIPAYREYRQTGEGDYWGYTFFDVNGKITWKSSPKTKLSISAFTGQDLQRTFEARGAALQSTDRMNIYNTGFSVAVAYVLNPKLFFSNRIGYSAYHHNSRSFSKIENYGLVTTEKSNTYSKIYDLTYNSSVEWTASNRHHVKTGVEATNYRFVPCVQTAFSEIENKIQTDTVIGVKSAVRSYEISIYGEDDITFSNQFKINAGLRATSYFCKDAEYFRVEPRFSLRWLFLSDFAAKMNYTVMNQFHHVVVNNTGGFEKEIWVAATGKLKPQNAEQASLGLFYGNDRRKTDISIEFFFKKMKNLVEYKNPVHGEVNWSKIESIMAVNGKGESYGMEFQYKKEMKNFNATIGYTLSRNNRQFDELNNGAVFPFMYDKTHDLSVLALWKISEKYSLAGIFSLATGTPVTLPVGYSANDELFYRYFIYESINNRRLPQYHRLDISLTRRIRMKNGNMRQFYINIFNVYARQNPVTVYYNNGKVYQKSLFVIVPTIGYSFDI